MNSLAAANRTGIHEARRRAAFARRAGAPSCVRGALPWRGLRACAPAAVRAARLHADASPRLDAAPHALHAACQALWALLMLLAAGVRRALWRTLRARLRRSAAPAYAAAPAPLRARPRLARAARSLHACCKLNKAPPALA